MFEDSESKLIKIFNIIEERRDLTLPNLIKYFFSFFFTQAYLEFPSALR